MILASKVPFACASTQSGSKVPGANGLTAQAYHGTTRKLVEEELGPLNFCSCPEMGGGENPGNCPLTKTSYNVEFAGKGRSRQTLKGEGGVLCNSLKKKKISPKSHHSIVYHT